MYLKKKKKFSSVSIKQLLNLIKFEEIHKPTKVACVKKCRKNCQT